MIQEGKTLSDAFCYFLVSHPFTVPYFYPLFTLSTPSCTLFHTPFTPSVVMVLFLLSLHKDKQSNYLLQTTSSPYHSSMKKSLCLVLYVLFGGVSVFVEERKTEVERKEREIYRERDSEGERHIDSERER